jgi:hypothetical protein
LASGLLHHNARPGIILEIFITCYQRFHKTCEMTRLVGHPDWLNADPMFEDHPDYSITEVF